MFKARTNCINCGAPLHNNKCEYCGAEYHLDNLGQIGEYKIKLKIFEQDRDFYISNIEKRSLYGDCGRDLQGNLASNKICEKLKIQLIEM